MKKTKIKYQKVAISLIVADGSTQSRAAMSSDHVEYLKDSFAKLPPPELIFDGEAYYIADGHHSLTAAQQLGKTTVEARVRNGDKRDALLQSVRANHTHGLPRTRADKIKATQILLHDPEWSKNSDRWISEQAGVSHTFVSKLRWSGGNVATSTPEKRQGADGKMYPPTATSGDDSDPQISDTLAKLNDPDSSLNENLRAATTQAEPDAADDEAPIDVTPDDPDSIAEEPVAAVAEVTAKDQTGKEIENPDVAAVFARRQELIEAKTEITRRKSKVLAAIQAGDELYSEFNISQFEADANNFYRHFRFSEPHAVCRFCLGERTKSCKACGGRGWVSELKYGATPEEMK